MSELITVKKPTAKEAEEAKSWPIWTKNPSTFEWSYDEKECCLIIEGEATVTPTNDGKAAHFTAGDYVVFPKGLDCTWKIEKTIKKHYKFG